MRGGRRPGAGAPRGNTNALKTGRHSQRVKIIVQSLLRDPEVRQILLRLGAKGRARNVYARELAVVMARLLYDQPIADAKRGALDRMADAALEAHTADTINDDIARFEHDTRIDAFTGQPLARRPHPRPDLEASTADLKRRLEAARQWREDRAYILAPEPANPPYLSALDGRPTRFGVNGPIDPADLEDWEPEDQ
jgi:hypothetical protein